MSTPNYQSTDSLLPRNEINESNKDRNVAPSRNYRNKLVAISSITMVLVGGSILMSSGRQTTGLQAERSVTSLNAEDGLMSQTLPRLRPGDAGILTVGMSPTKSPSSGNKSPYRF